MTSKSLFLMITVVSFIMASVFYFLILIQFLNFSVGLAIFGILIFFLFWYGLLASRRLGEMSGFKNKKQLFVVSWIVSSGFVEIFWSISFLPFSFFVLGGIFASFFSTTFDIMKESFRIRRDLFSEIETNEFLRTVKKDAIIAAMFIIILILISPWMPIRN